MTEKQISETSGAKTSVVGLNVSVAALGVKVTVVGWDLLNFTDKPYTGTPTTKPEREKVVASNDTAMELEYI